MVEGWDLNGSPRPADAPYRFLLLVKGDAAYEAGAAPPPAVQALLDRWTAEKIVISEAKLKPSKTGARSKPTAGKRQWIDGPFSESKELIGGYSILELPSIADAKQFCDEYAAILVDNEVDLREVA